MHLVKNYLFGIAYPQNFFDKQVSKIERICNMRDKVLMLELSASYEENVIKGIFKPNFACRLAERYRPICSKVILGDQEITIPENPDWILSLVMGEDYFYPDNRRDEIMRQTIERERPDIVIVGNGHSNRIKEHFFDFYYTVFEEDGGYSSSFTGHAGPQYEWNNPNKIITLR